MAALLLTFLTLSLLANINVNLTQAAPIPPDRTPTTSKLQIFSESPAVLSAGRYSSLLNMGLDNSRLLKLAGEGYSPPRWSGDWADFGLFSALPQQFEEPFNSLKAGWTASQPAGTALEVDVRASPDGQNWTLWQILDTQGQTASFGADNAFLFAQYRVRMFSSKAGLSPTLGEVRLEANRRSLTNLNTRRLFSSSNITASNVAAAPPTYNIHATREGLVGGRTANGHIIQNRDHFVSLPSWTSLNDLGQNAYQVRITTPAGRSAIAPVWDVGPWNFKDNYWHNPRFEFKDLPVGVPQAEKAFYEKHNGGLNESGRYIANPSGIDIGDGTYWDDLALQGAQDGRVNVTFIWEAPVPTAPVIRSVRPASAWQNGGQVRWSTSALTTSRIDYGLTTAYGQSTWTENKLLNEHERMITDLVPGQTYHYRLVNVDIYGVETVSEDRTLQTLAGLTLPLNAYQQDNGLSITTAKDNSSLLLYGGRANNSYWNDNPQNDYSAGAVVSPGSLAMTGNLDFDLSPVCDESGKNCSMGAGSGFKNFVRFGNEAGETFEVGLIHDAAGLSPQGVTLMFEGNLKNSIIRRYEAPGAVDQQLSHHFHVFWWANKLLVVFDHGSPQVFEFNSQGMSVAFVGAGRAKNDVVAANFNNIAFSPDAIAPKSGN